MDASNEVWVVIVSKTKSFVKKKKDKMLQVFFQILYDFMFFLNFGLSVNLWMTKSVLRGRRRPWLLFGGPFLSVAYLAAAWQKLLGFPEPSEVIQIRQQAGGKSELLQDFSVNIEKYEKKKLKCILQ